jgi:hypothetical protein
MGQMAAPLERQHLWSISTFELPKLKSQRSLQSTTGSLSLFKVATTVATAVSNHSQPEQTHGSNIHSSGLINESGRLIFQPTSLVSSSQYSVAYVIHCCVRHNHQRRASEFTRSHGCRTAKYRVAGVHGHQGKSRQTKANQGKSSTIHSCARNLKPDLAMGSPTPEYARRCTRKSKQEFHAAV